MKNNCAYDIDEKNQSVARKIKEDSEKINIENAISDIVVKAIENQAKKRREKRGYAVVSAVAACIVLAISLNAGINWNSKVNISPTYNHKNMNNQNQGTSNGIPDILSYTEIYERLSAVDMIEKIHLNESNLLKKQNMCLDSGIASSAEGLGTKDYYDTNEQTDDVHEGDIVKTDGKYIYTLTYDELKMNYKVIITRASNGKLTRASEINLTKGKKIRYYFDNIYVEKDKLIIIGSKYGDSEFVCYNGSALSDVAYGNGSTIIYVYDISDRIKPILFSENEQEGIYLSSRLSGGFLYTVSSCWMRELSKEKCVPEVNGRLISSSDVYMREYVDNWNYTVVTTLDLSKSQDYKEVIAVAGGTDTLYASRENLYLISNSLREENIINSEQGEKDLKNTNLEKYNNKEVKVKREEKKYIRGKYKDLDLNGIKAYKDTGVYLYTNTVEIVKLKYSEDGMVLVADTSVDGYTNDNLSFDEKDGYLRFVATTETRKNVEIRINYYDENGNYLFNIVDDERHISISDELNNVYVLDEKLVEKAHIERLAEGERIYSARYFGDYGYFVTYEKTDPLFSVDFTDMEEPKIIGKLKITGFSEYLHFYTENKLLGLGIETNPKNGKWIGFKMEMYNISEKSAEVEGKLVLKNFEVLALYNYKALMVDSGRKWIGFVAEDESEHKMYYIVYTYENCEFKELIKVTLDDDTMDNDITGYNARGFYIEDYLYIVNPEYGIKSIDLKNLEKNEIAGEIKF